MDYLLDTNIVIYFFRDQFNLKSKFSKNQSGSLFISEITLAELFYGAELSNKPKHNKFLIQELILKVAVVPISSSIEDFAKQKAILRKQVDIIPDFDILIGSTAISNDLKLVTQNTKDLKRLRGIQLEDWTK